MGLKTTLAFQLARQWKSVTSQRLSQVVLRQEGLKVVMMCVCLLACVLVCILVFVRMQACVVFFVISVCV